uniref:SH3 domain-containing protein n=1 Tax=Gouania willdenowi TaxID=441366 RepID=A0A8C5GYT5_GOUWI
MQQNADKVEKDILRAEDLLAVDAENDKKEQPFEHQSKVSEHLTEAEGLVKNLFLDIDKLKKLKHPQAKDIETDVCHLHERWLKDCLFYRDIYEQIDDVSLMPRIDWGPVFREKQKSVNNEQFGPSIGDLEKQIASHNILHKELESYNSQLCVNSAGNKENSKWRRHYLNSLYEYMQGSNKELSFLAEEQDKIKKQDWSDRIADPADVRRQYENFKNNSLLGHESEVNKLQDEGDRLIELKHPASDAIQRERDAVRNEWQKFLNLCICQETHLDNVEEYKKQRSIMIYFVPSTLQAEENTVQNCEQLLSDLRRRSTTIPPLKPRRNPPTRPITVESLCDWETDEGSLSRGEKFTLKSNADENWDVVTSNGENKNFPGVCFLIPPPDPDAIDIVDLLGDELTDIKKRRAALASSLKNHKADVARSQQSAPTSSAPLDPKMAALAEQLDKLDGDLGNTEQSMLNNLRTPLDRSNPSGDLADRLRKQEVTANALRALEQQRKAAQADLQPLLSKDPSGTSTGLPLKLSAANNKYDSIAALADLYAKKANASLELENQITKVDGLVSGLEKNLSEDGPIPDVPNTIQARIEDIQYQKNAVAASQGDMRKLGKDLEATEQLCSSLQQGYQEYCPDIERQRKEVKQLQNRYANVANQVKERESLLQEAASKNQEFQNTTKGLKSFLNNLPKNQINSTDDLSEIASKQSSQEVGFSPFYKNSALLNEEKVQMVAQQQVQRENMQKSAFELDNLSKELEDERERTAFTETNLRTFKNRLLSLENRRGVERIEEKEVLQYYRDPKLEGDLTEFKTKLHEETLKRSTIQTEVEVINSKVTILEDNRKSTPPKLATREVTEFEKDPQLDIEAARLRDEISKLRDENRVKEGEHIQMKTEVTILQQKRPPIKERVVKKEVVKVEKDPEMLKAVRTFETEISDESNKIKLINDDVFRTRHEINALERLIPNIPPKVITKEVKKVEQDPEMINESKRIRTSIEEERIENNSLYKEVLELQSHYREVQDWKPKVEVKEIVNEIYQIDPSTEREILRLRKDIQDYGKKCSDLDRDISQITSEVNVLRSEKPKVEMKEVLQEVIKEERSPENEREIQRLNDQVNYLHTRYNTLQDQVRLLSKERDEWKTEKSKIETKLINREVIKYESDPLQEKEAARLRKNLREEAQMRRSIEEMVFDLQNKYIQLERQRPQEKVVVQEVVRLQKDPRQVVEHERLSRNLDDEVKTRRQLELELQQLRAKVEDLERTLRQSNERQKRIQAESELREIRLRITQLQNAPPPVEESIVVEEVLKVERDPKLERMTSGLRTDMDKETSEILRLQREIRNLTLKLEILRKEKSGEKTVYKEVVRVEKDQAVEAERDRLREQVSQNKFARQDLEDEIRRLSEKMNLLRNSKTSSSRQETTLTLNRDTLQREKDNLTRELRTLETTRQDISYTFQQQSRIVSEKTQMSRQKSLRMDSEVQRMEREILDEKDQIHMRDSTIRELLMTLQKEENSETRTKETNVSTKITILDPETGKDMSPYDAYVQGLIDRQQYIQLQELECDWEEITSMGPDGEVSVLQDGKSGKQYSIKDALKEGRLTEYDVQQYKKGKIPISEFALMVAGDNKKQPQMNSILTKSKSSSSPPENGPVAGIIDIDTGTCYTVRSAAMRKLIDSATAQRLLEAQAATGGITDIQTKERFSVNKAATRGLIDESQHQRLLNAQKACTGVEDPVTKERLSVGEAAQKGWMPQDNAIRYAEAQYLTGGLIDPKTGKKVSFMDAISSNMIDSTMTRKLQSDSNYIKDIVDPITKEKINYKQALDRCKIDQESGLRMLPASSKASKTTVKICITI